ncbi:MAG: hypothetical protein E6447_25295, partial [Bradyrhizobium sp.]|nr:hypothetical protein [Bradyrhizobium sp.]
MHGDKNSASKTRLIAWHLRQCEKQGDQGISKPGTFSKRSRAPPATFDPAQALVTCPLLRTGQMLKCPRNAQHVISF